MQKQQMKPQFTIEERTGRGKGIFADMTIQKGSRISPLSGWMPLVAPVLHGKFRSERCALCFSSLDSQQYTSMNFPLYNLCFCTVECQRVGLRDFGMDAEAQAIQNLCKRGQAPPKILSTAILLYRMFLAQKDFAIRDKVEALQSGSQRGETEANVA